MGARTLARAEPLLRRRGCRGDARRRSTRGSRGSASGRRGGGRALTFVVRPADPADAPGLKQLGDAVASEPEGWLATQDGWRSVGDERRYLRAIRRYPHAAVFVAEL